jgi:hypothetical protein
VAVEAPPGETAPELICRRAAAACREALAPVVAGWERQVAQRWAVEEQELERYYRQWLSEEVDGLGRLFHRVAVLEVRVHLAKKAATRRQFRRELRRWEGELAGQLGGKEERAGSLAADLARRQEELARRYQGEVRVELVEVAPLDREATAWPVVPAGQE